MQRYEELADVIDHELEKRRGSWRLHSIRYIDFDDVKQEIKIHIYEKWNLWDQQRPFLNWVNRVITHKLINKVRDLYGIYARPCLKCSFNQSKEPKVGQTDNLCGYTKSGLQCSECELYAEWEQKKKPMHDVHLPHQLDHHEHDIHYHVDEIDYEEFLRNVDVILKETLKPVAYKIFKYTFIEKLSREKVAEKMGYKTKNISRPAGYKQITNNINIIRSEIKKLLKSEDYQFINKNTLKDAEKEIS